MQPTLALTLTSKTHYKTGVLTHVFMAVLGSVFVGVMSQVAIVLPFTPVPITGQTLAVLLIGASYGRRIGAMTLGLYLVQGALGIPVFHNGGFGIGHLVGPTGGYLIGFVVSAYVVGLLAQKGLDRNVWTALLVFLVGNVIIVTLGCVWLSVFVGFQNAITMGLVPFVIGDIAKILVATVLLPSSWRLVSAMGLPKNGNCSDR